MEVEGSEGEILDLIDDNDADDDESGQYPEFYRAHFTWY